jgi:hypothetical protein
MGIPALYLHSRCARRAPSARDAVGGSRHRRAIGRARTDGLVSVRGGTPTHASWWADFAWSLVTLGRDGARDMGARWSKRILCGTQHRVPQDCADERSELRGLAGHEKTTRTLDNLKDVFTVYSIAILLIRSGLFFSAQQLSQMRCRVYRTAEADDRGSHRTPPALPRIITIPCTTYEIGLRRTAQQPNTLFPPLFSP